MRRVDDRPRSRAMPLAADRRAAIRRRPAGQTALVGAIGRRLEMSTGCRHIVSPCARSPSPPPWCSRRLARCQRSRAADQRVCTFDPAIRTRSTSRPRSACWSATTTAARSAGSASRTSATAATFDPKYAIARRRHDLRDDVHRPARQPRRRLHASPPRPPSPPAIPGRIADIWIDAIDIGPTGEVWVAHRRERQAERRLSLDRQRR